MTDAPQAPRPVLRKDVCGRLFAALRIRKGLTQTQMGKALGMSQSAVDRLESGSSSISTELLLDFAAALRTSGTFVVCLLEALMFELVQEGYDIVPSPRRRTGADGVLPESALHGPILAGYVTGWLERHRADPLFYDGGTLDAWEHGEASQPSVHALAYSQAPAWSRVMVPQQ